MSTTLQSTEHLYDMKRSLRSLTGAERSAAKALKKARPPVHPGTRVCISRQQQLAWFDKVRAEGKRIKVPDARWQAFCDVAGVPS